MSTNIKLKRSSVQGKIPLTGDLELGELAINTYDGKLYMKKNDGTDSIVDITAGGSAPSLDLVTAAGSTTNNAITVGGITSTANAVFGDNVRAVFGAGSDLQIYHDGLDSYIVEQATGSLGILTNGPEVVIGKTPFESMARFATDGAVTLYYDNAAKLATTATGIDVTGTVTADGLTVNKGSDGSDIVSLTGASAGRYLNIQSFTNSGSAGAGYDFNATSGQGAIQLSTVGNARLKVDNNGDISFYEATGTTPKFFWDASAEALGIGTSSPALQSAGQGIHINGANYAEIKFTNTTTGSAATDGTALVASGSNFTINNREAGVLQFNTSNTERMRITSTGSVGIGTSSPATALDVNGTVTADGLTVSSTSGTLATLTRTGANGVYLALTDDSGSHVFLGNSGGQFQVQTAGASYASKLTVESNGDISFYETTGTTPKFFWDASTERLGIGTSSPAAILDISSNGNRLRISQDTSGNTLNGIDFYGYSGGLTGGLLFNQSTGEIRLNATSSYYQTLYSNGVERMRIDVAGNVGIGTASPSLFHAAADNLVVGTTSGDNGITIASGTANQASLFFADGTTGGVQQAAGYLIYVHSSDYMAMGTGNTERLRINSSGLSANGTVTATAFSGPLTGAVTGNASTATTLQTARTIGGVSFNGSANINLPGVNAVGNQNTTGSAATLTTARAIQVSGAVTGTANFDGSAAINIVTTATSDPTLTLAGDATGSATFTNLGNATLTVAIVDDSHNHSSSSGNFTVNGDLTTTANTTIGGSLQVDGDLTVSGNTVTINVSDLAVEDNMIYLNSGSTVANPDLGFAGNYNDGTYAHAGFFRDATDGYFKVFKGYTPEPDASAFIDTSHASFALADIQAANFRGALVGNATTATTLQTARTIGMSGVTATATSFNGSANITIPVTAVPATLLTGTIADARISGSYTGLTNLTGTGTVDFAKFLGNAADSAAAPSFSWTGDTNTGIFQPAADQIGFSTAGTVKMTLDASGNLDINGNLAIDGFGNNKYISFRDGFDATNVGIRAKAIATANRDGIEILGYNGIDLTVNNGLNVAMRINSAGNVGIGTSSPTTALEVTGTITSDGLVVDGTATVTGTNVTIKNNASFLKFENASAARTGYIQSRPDAFEVWNDQTTPMVFGTTNTERMRINSSGNVAINSNGAVDGLDGVFGLQVGNSSNAASGISIATANRGYLWYIPSGSTSLSLWDSTANSDRLTINSSGNVGIGTSSPATKLHVSGTADQYIIVQSGDNAGKAGLRFQGAGDRGSIYGTSGYDIYIEPNAQYGQADVIINSKNGTTMNVGIGTSTPGYKLEVNGSFAATTKSFVIDHPTKPNMKLRHGSLEGPEDGVYVRGRLKDNNVIELPDYWTGLVHEDSITVNLTAIGRGQDIWVEDIVDNTVIVGGENVNCFYTVFAARKDVEKFDVEYEVV